MFTFFHLDAYDGLESWLEKRAFKKMAYFILCRQGRELLINSDKSSIFEIGQAENGRKEDMQWRNFFIYVN